MAAGAPDPLFGLRNNFCLGAYQAAINNSDIPNLSSEDAFERDSLVYRSYIALGSYQLVINEIDSSAATPLQAVKLLAMYLASPANKENMAKNAARMCPYMIDCAGKISVCIYIQNLMGFEILKQQSQVFRNG